MLNPICSQSVPEAVGVQIEQDIAEGVLRKFMPGSRELARRYGVSNGSVCTALKQLEQRGVIEVGHRGRKRRILRTSPDRNSKRRQVLLCVRSDSTWLDSDDEGVWLEMANTIWRPGDNEVVEVTARSDGKGQVKHMVARWLAEFSPDRIVVIHGSRNWLQELVATRLPVFCLGGEVGGLIPQISGYASAVSCVLELVLSRLQKQGHTRILLPQPCERSSYVDSAFRSYKKVFGDLYGDDEIRALCPALPLPDVLDWQRFWLKHLDRTDATAVVSMRENEVISLIASCMAAGIRVPKDLRIVAVTDSVALGWLAPIADRVTHDQRIALKLFRQWLAGQQPDFHVLKPQWHDLQGKESDTDRLERKGART